MAEARPSAEAERVLGSCLCGGIRFQISGPLAAIQICHCSQCRKAQGTPFASNIPVERAAFEFLSGEALLQAYESSPGKQRHFCSRCGSPVFSSRNSLPGIVRIRAGLLEEPLGVRVGSEAHTESRCEWWP
jgi:hypothetical protein